MAYDPPPHVRGLIRFWWHVSLYLVAETQRKLGFVVTHSKPFLSRLAHRDLARLLALLEPALRRVFYLQAAALGPLPARAAPGRAGRPRPVAPRRPSGRVRPAQPRFRLTEARHRALPPRPVAARWRTGPNIRFLDRDYPVDLRDYPPREDDLLPATALVRRLAAINHALDNPDTYITGLRRRMAVGRPILAASLPPGFRARWLQASLRESAHALQGETRRTGPPDTS